MWRRGLSQVTQAKRLVGEVADSDTDDLAEPSLLQPVRLGQARKLEDQDCPQPHCSKSKIYLHALQTAFAELGKLNPRSLTRNISYELKTFTCRDVKGIPDNRAISSDYQTT